MATLVREEEKAPENWQKKTGAEEMEKGEVVPGITVGSLRRFKAALIGLTQGFPKRRRLRRYGSLRILRVRCWTLDVFPLGGDAR